MKKFTALLFLSCVVILWPAQNNEVGWKVFSNDEGAINLIVDASVASRCLDSAYIMFVLYMGTDKNMKATVHRDDVFLVYQQKEYRMPSLEEWRANYTHDNRDSSIYFKFKSAIFRNILHHYRFRRTYNFFPSGNQASRVYHEAEMDADLAVTTYAYFKNPGFKKGDTVVVKVRDKKDPEMRGATTVIL